MQSSERGNKTIMSMIVCNNTNYAALECHRLNNPSNGLVTVNSYHVGGLATYECYSGYTLRGPTTRTCLPSKQWSESQPSCPRRCFFSMFQSCIIKVISNMCLCLWLHVFQALDVPL